jgi:hypothetical protein
MIRDHSNSPYACSIPGVGTLHSEPKIWLLIGVCVHSQPFRLGFKVLPRAFCQKQPCLVTYLMVHLQIFSEIKVRKLEIEIES